jgi:hypothetical protein
MNPLYEEFLLGHRSGGLAIESHLRPTENDLLGDNAGVIDALTVNEQHKLRRKVETLTEKQNEIQNMKNNNDEQEMKHCDKK